MHPVTLTVPCLLLCPRLLNSCPSLPTSPWPSHLPVELSGQQSSQRSLSRLHRGRGARLRGSPRQALGFGLVTACAGVPSTPSSPAQDCVSSTEGAGTGPAGEAHRASVRASPRWFQPRRAPRFAAPPSRLRPPRRRVSTAGLRRAPQTPGPALGLQALHTQARPG